MTAVIGNHCFKPQPEPDARPPDVGRGQGAPHWPDGSLQRLNVAVRLSTCLPCNTRPNRVIKRIEIWRVRRPDLLGQNLIPLSISQAWALLDVWQGAPWQGVDFGSRCKKNWWHLLAIGRNEAKHHDAGRMFGLKFILDVVRNIFCLFGTHVPIKTAVWDGINVKNFLIRE